MTALWFVLAVAIGLAGFAVPSRIVYLLDHRRHAFGRIDAAVLTTVAVLAIPAGLTISFLIFYGLAKGTIA